MRRSTSTAGLWLSATPCALRQRIAFALKTEQIALTLASRTLLRVAGFPETLAAAVHLVEQRSEMSMTRFGGAWQPAWARTASVVIETGSTFNDKLQTILEQTRRTLDDTWRSMRALFFDDQLPGMLAALLTPAAVVALVFGLWRFSADLKWTEAFPISTGFFSHWQVWIALAIGLEFLASSGLAAYRGRVKSAGEN